MIMPYSIVTELSCPDFPAINDIIPYPEFRLKNLFNLANPSCLYTYDHLLKAWPEDLDHPASYAIPRFPIANIYSCTPKYVPLFNSSLHFKTQILFKTPSCCNPTSNFIYDVDHSLYMGDVFTATESHEKFIDLILEDFHINYLEHTEYDSKISLNSQRILGRKLARHVNTTSKQEIDYQYFPQEILCHCQVETTSGFKNLYRGLGAGVYSAYNLLAFNNDENKIVEFIENWTLDIVNLSINFNIPTIIITFLKLFKVFMPISEFIFKLIETFNHLFNNLCSSIGKTVQDFLAKPVSLSVQQPSTAAESALLEEFDSGRVEITSGSLQDLAIMEPILQYVAETPVIATLMASFVVLSGGLVLSNLSVSENKKLSVGDKISHSFNNISKVKGGAYSCIEMIKDFKIYLLDYISSVLGLQVDSALLQVLNTVTIPDTETHKKEDLFTYINHLLNPINKGEITTSKLMHDRLNFCISVIDQVHNKVANTEAYLSNVSLNYLLSKVIELKKLRLHVVKYTPEPSYRMTPFWINLAGGPGTGKSALMPKITTTIMTILQKNGNFNVPEKDNWTYPVNFTDKFLSKYNQHYCVTIDDLLQDTAPLGDRSSALDIISWVSCIPYYTNQADIESKGTPFTSKLILSTTNDLSMANRKEIISTEALKRRIKVQAVFIKDSKAPSDPDLLPGVRIELRNPETGVKIRDVSSKELMAYAVSEYMKHYEHEQKLMVSRSPTTTEISEVEDLMVSMTSGWFNRCTYGFTPKFKTVKFDQFQFEVFDCTCDIHTDINYEYADRFYRTCFSNDTCDLTIEQFAKVLKLRDQEVSAELSRFKIATQKVKTLLSDYLLTPTGKFLIKAAAAAAGALVFYTGYQAFLSIKSGKDGAEISAAQYDSGKPGRSRPKHAAIFKRVPVKPVPTELIVSNGVGYYFQSHCSDDQATQLINRTAANGSIVRLIRRKDGLVNTALMIRGSYMLTNHHYFSEFKDGDVFDVYTNLVGDESVVTQTFMSSKLKQVRDLDACIYQCDTSVLSKYKSIVKHFLSQEDQDCSDINAVVMTAIPSFQTIVNLVAKSITCNVPYSNTSQTEKYRLLKSYVINYEVQFGQSGSLLIGLNKMQKRKFLGIQTCRDIKTKLGYFIPLTEQDLAETLMLFEDKLDYEMKIPEAIIQTNGVMDERCPGNLAHNSLYYVGSVDKTKFVKPQTISKIVPSLIQDPETLTQQQSVLSDYDTRMKVELQGKPVIFRAIQGFDDKIGTIDRLVLKKAVNELSIDYDFTVSHPAIQRKVLTDFETINGIPGLIKRIEMNSSPGWPYAVMRKNTTLGGKYEWFDQMDTPPEGYSLAYQMKPSLMRGLKHRESEAKAGRNVLTIAYVCLKDETRPLAKIESGSTRAFICLPMDFNLLVKKYFGAFIATQHLLAGRIASCVGIDPATQWKVLYDRLNEKNVLWEDFDYKNWDQHLHPELVYQVSRVINAWYGDDDNSENGLIRRILILDLVHTFIIVKDRLFIKSTGQCSGCAITAELNCIVHELLMFYVWIKLHQDKNLTTDIEEFRQQTAMALYGDDILLSVDNPRVEFSGNTIKPIMESLGMGITPGNKLATEFTIKKPEELEFLKRSFREERNTVKAPLRMDVINNIYQWIHKSDNNIDATHTNIRAALQECYMHSRTSFNKLLKEINLKIKLYNEDNLIKIPPVICSYEDFDAKYQRNEFLCLGLAETLPRHSSSDFD